VRLVEAMTARMKIRTLGVGFMLAVAMLALPAAAQATHHGSLPDINAEITELTAAPEPSPITSTATQAGGHPNFRIVARFCDASCSLDQSQSPVKDFTVRLPPGLLGNPGDIPACPEPLFAAGACPPESQVAETTTLAFQGGGTLTIVDSPLYNVDTLGLEPARLGTRILPASPPGPLPVKVTLDSSSEDTSDPTEGDFSVDATAPELPRNLNGQAVVIFQIETLLYGQNPALKPFFVNPTSCDPKKVEVAVTSYSNPEGETRARTGEGSYGPAFTPTGCTDGPTPVPFDLGVSATPDNTVAGAPSGYTVSLDYPDFTNFDVWESALKHAVVKLPPGVSLAAGGGIGLQACTAEQFGVLSYGNASTQAKVNGDPVKCPAGSEIGTVSVETPVLKNPGADDIPGGDASLPDLTGKAYFGPATAPGQPTAAQPWKLFLSLEGFGLRVKLIGDVTVDNNGRITTTFLNQPQVPFSNLTLHTDDQDAAIGQFAPLANPKACGNYKVQADFTGHNGAVIHPEDATGFDISADGAGADCPSPRPFQPSIEDASAVPTQAAAFSRSHLLIDRPDGHQIMKHLNLFLPPGATGSLNSVPLCPASQVGSGNCGPESKVGVIRTTVGTGDGLLKVSGSVYLGEATVGGDAASFVIVIPAKVGPIDLGKVVLVNRVKLRADDQGVNVYSPEIPTIFGGIPLPVRKIEIDINREHFFLNPTGCDQRFFNASFDADEGGTATAKFAAQATGCDKVPFAPKIQMITGAKGQTGAGKHPPLRAIVTQEQGEAAIAKARVVVPDIVRPNVPQFNKPGGLCNDAQLASRTCPPLSEVGSAKVVTPLLPFALKGPVFIVQTAASPLPKLAVFLQGGGIEVVLSAKNGFQGIRILNTFDYVPDVPQSYFELAIKGGNNGILNAFANLCNAKSKPPPVDATFTGWNGKTFSTKPPVEIKGCTSSPNRGVSIMTKKAKMSAKGVVKIKLRCLNRTRCRGRLSLKTAGAVASKRQKLALGSKSFNIPARKKRTIKLKLRSKGRSVVRTRNDLKVRGTTKVGKKSRHKTITIKD
jgi:hypothetical protein